MTTPASPHTPRIRALRDASIGYGLLPWVTGPRWELAEDYTFTLAVSNAEAAPCYYIPAGYQFDKASVPPCFWGFPFHYLPDGLCTVPALEHDYLCDLLTGGSAWLRDRVPSWMLTPPPVRAVHEHFEVRLLQFGVRPGKARAMGLAVKILGPGTRLGNILAKLT